VYFSLSSGSVGVLFIAITFDASSQNFHWYDIGIQLDVIVTALSGLGKSHVFTFDNSNQLSIFFSVDTLFVSLADFV
jgi:hypothetical protein